MFENLDVFKTAHAMAKHAGRAQAVSAQNVANADTPGYVARALPAFETLYRGDGAGLQRATRAQHLNGSSVDHSAPLHGVKQEGSPNGNAVSLELEMVSAATAKRQHDQALAIYKSGLQVLRTALGR